VLDGAYGFDFVTAVAYKLHEIAPNFYDIGDGPHAPSVIIMNRQVWEGLPAEHQQICTDLADELYGGKFAEIYNKVLADYTQKALAEGVVLSSLSEEEKARTKAIVQPAQVNKWIETVAQPNGIDGKAMQAVVDEAVARHAGTGTMKRPLEIAEGL
jgi:TRAP-type C4-dicarboxylate transport system substrate-binding protein